jgi:Uma2 family endonuclease
VDVSFYSHAIVPPGPLPEEYFTSPPDAIFEALSPSDRWDIHRQVTEYLTAGMPVVYVVEPELQQSAPAVFP